jgi:hypothetical protein
MSNNLRMPGIRTNLILLTLEDAVQWRRSYKGTTCVLCCLLHELAWDRDGSGSSTKV